MIEEAYEALGALDSGDTNRLREELGDLLLNIFIHCQIASEAGEFELRDVVRSIAEKLVRRHPHVFGDLQLTTAGQVMENWEVLKSKERPERESRLEGLPSALPALAYTRSLEERVAPLQLPIGQLKAPIAGGPAARKRKDNASSLEELGKTLFEVAFQASAAGLDPEEALRLTNARFRSKVQRLEELAWAQGKPLVDLTAEARAELWRRVEETSE